MSIETRSSVSSLTLWAGRSIVFIAVLHIGFFIVMSWSHLPGWFTGDLWAPSDEMSSSEGYFWALIGGFAVPLLLVGALVIRFAREDRVVPAYVTWTLTAWVVVCSLLVEPSGFPLGLVPVGLLIVAERRRVAPVLSERAQVAATR